jgi:5-methylcytosine-specific restriction protein A
MSGWSDSDRRQRLPPDWPKRRGRILKRDNHSCQTIMDDGTKCLDYAGEVDHKTPGDDHEDYNLEAICTWHHKRKSSQEGAAANNIARARIRRSFRRTETHPGLL